MNRLNCVFPVMLLTTGLWLYGCGGGACKTPNPNYDASDPTSIACLTGTSASADLENEADQVCIPGTSQECSCGGVFQECREDGQGYTSCACPGIETAENSSSVEGSDGPAPTIPGEGGDPEESNPAVIPGEGGDPEESNPAVIPGEGGEPSEESNPTDEGDASTADEEEPGPLACEAPTENLGIEPGKILDLGGTFKNCDGEEVTLIDLACGAKAVLITIDAGWCEPCKEQAAGREENIIQFFKDQGLVVINLLTEDANSQPATQGTCNQWTSDFGLTSSVLTDPQKNSKNWIKGDPTTSLPVNILLNEDYVITNYLVGGLSSVELQGKIEEVLGEGKEPETDLCLGVVCPTDDPCSVSACDPFTGECVSEVNAGDPCDDGDTCTSTEYCQESSGGFICSVFGDGKSGTEYCQFEEDQQGKDLGNHVKNFGMKTHEGCPYWMHQSCGTEKKVIWMILAAGWCGTCESYVERVEEIYQANKEHLEVLWVMGEDDSKQAPSLDYLANWKAEKGVTFTVLRDASFFQAYGSVNNFGIGSLPHLYVVRGTNMELLFADGGVSTEAENLLFQELGVD